MLDICSIDILVSPRRLGYIAGYSLENERAVIFLIFVMDNVVDSSCSVHCDFVLDSYEGDYAKVLSAVHSKLPNTKLHY